MRLIRNSVSFGEAGESGFFLGRLRDVEKVEISCGTVRSKYDYFDVLSERSE